MFPVPTWSPLAPSPFIRCYPRAGMVLGTGGGTGKRTCLSGSRGIDRRDPHSSGSCGKEWIRALFCSHCSASGLGQVPTGAAGGLSLPLSPGVSVTTPAICSAHPRCGGLSMLVRPPLTHGIKNRWTRAFLYPQVDGSGVVHKPPRGVPRDCAPVAQSSGRLHPSALYSLSFLDHFTDKPPTSLKLCFWGNSAN